MFLRRVQLLGRSHLARQFATASQSGSPWFERLGWATEKFLTTKVIVPLPFVVWGCNATLQLFFGNGNDFFNGKFVTEKEPDDLAEFYQAEDLLKIIAVHPIFFNLFMNKVQASDAEITEETMLLSQEETHFKVSELGMEVSFEILTKEDENEDGEAELKEFKRHERFIDYVPFLSEANIKVLLWDQTWTYGFRKLENGKTEVFHHGEQFVGPWPIRMIVFFHQYYVLWACEKYINGNAFGSDDLDAKEEQMECLPLFKFREFLNKNKHKGEETEDATGGLTRTKTVKLHLTPSARPFSKKGHEESDVEKPSLGAILMGAHPSLPNA